MKVLGFVIIVVGFVLVWVGVTGSQHNLMATLKGSNNPAKSGQPINPSGASTDSTGLAPGTVQTV